jgi:hypothetical protein
MIGTQGVINEGNVPYKVTANKGVVKQRFPKINEKWQFINRWLTRGCKRGKRPLQGADKNVCTDYSFYHQAYDYTGD